jgi:hypothetical protein
MDHHLLTERRVASDGGRMMDDPVVGRKRPVDHGRMVAAHRVVAHNRMTVNRRMAQNVMRYDMVMRGRRVSYDVVVMDPMVMDRRVARRRDRRGRNREGDRRHAQEGEQQAREKTLHGFLPPTLVAPPRLTPAAVSIPLARGRASPR